LARTQRRLILSRYLQRIAAPRCRRRGLLSRGSPSLTPKPTPRKDLPWSLIPLELSPPRFTRPPRSSIAIWDIRVRRLISLYRSPPISYCRRCLLHRGDQTESREALSASLQLSHEEYRRTTSGRTRATQKCKVNIAPRHRHTTSNRIRRQGCLPHHVGNPEG